MAIITPNLWQNSGVFEWILCIFVQTLSTGSITAVFFQLLETLRNPVGDASQNVIWYSAKQVLFPHATFDRSSKRPLITRRCLTNIVFLWRHTFRNTEFYFGGLDLQYRMPEIVFQSCETDKDDLRVTQGMQIRMKHEESFEFKVLNKTNIAFQLPLSSWFRKLPIIKGNRLLWPDLLLSNAKELHPITIFFLWPCFLHSVKPASISTRYF